MSKNIFLSKTELKNSIDVLDFRLFFHTNNLWLNAIFKWPVFTKNLKMWAILMKQYKRACKNTRNSSFLNIITHLSKIKQHQQRFPLFSLNKVIFPRRLESNNLEGSCQKYIGIVRIKSVIEKFIMIGYLVQWFHY